MFYRALILFASARNTMTGIVVIVVLCVGYFGYDYYLRHGLQVAPQRPVPPVLDVAVNDICREVPGQLPEPERVLKPTLLLPLEGDRENIFADRLRSSLDQQGWYRPVDANLLNRTLDTIRELTGIGSDTSARSMQWSPTELANMMRSANAETVLRGSVDRLALPEGSPVEIKLRLELWGLSPTEPTTAVLIRSLLLERPESAAVTTNASKPTHWKAYGLIILIALVYPFATIPWMRHAIREDSNTAILKVLLGITAIPVLIFFVYLIWQGKDALTIVLQAGIAALLLFLYTAFILNTLQNKLK